MLGIAVDWHDSMGEPLNPYAPPRDASGSLMQAVPRSTPVVALYRSAAGKARFAQWAALVTLMLRIVMAGSFGLQIMLLLDAQQSGELDSREAQFNNFRHQAISGIVGLSAVVCFIALLFWIHAAYSNLEAFGARHLNFTAGWAVGSFFIPIVNFWQPYQALHEVWSYSDPNLERGWAARPATLLTCWWILWAIAAIAGRVLMWVGRASVTIDQILGLSIAALIAVVALELPTLACQFLLIGRLQQFQDEHLDILVQRANSERQSNARNLAQFQQE